MVCLFISHYVLGRPVGRRESSHRRPLMNTVRYGPLPSSEMMISTDVLCTCRMCPLLRRLTHPLTKGCVIGFSRAVADMNCFRPICEKTACMLAVATYIRYTEERSTQYLV